MGSVSSTSAGIVLPRSAVQKAPSLSDDIRAMMDATDAGLMGAATGP